MRVFVAVEPVDLRKSFTGLNSIVLDRLKKGPCSGALFVFTNLRRNRIKTLYWDGTGMWGMIKRIEQAPSPGPRALVKTKSSRLHRKH